jgi:hypothetical protein
MAQIVVATPQSSVSFGAYSRHNHASSCQAPLTLVSRHRSTSQPDAPPGRRLRRCNLRMQAAWKVAGSPATISRAKSCVLCTCICRHQSLPLRVGFDFGASRNHEAACYTVTKGPNPRANARTACHRDLRHPRIPSRFLRRLGLCNARSSATCACIWSILLFMALGKDDLRVSVAPGTLGSSCVLPVRIST